MSIVEVKNLSKKYRSGTQIVKALDDVSFSIHKGELIAVVGASGSGKSTLLHLLGGIDEPTSGSVIIGGQDIYQMNEKKRTDFLRSNVGIIYQFFNLVPILNVRENISLPLLLDGKNDLEFVDELLKELQLEERITHLPSQLSGGQQQRVAIGRALAARPKLILADEPTGNLDRKMSEEIIGLLREASDKYEQTILMVTHDDSIAAVCDRIIRIEDGRIR